MLAILTYFLRIVRYKHGIVRGESQKCETESLGYVIFFLFFFLFCFVFFFSGGNKLPYISAHTYKQPKVKVSALSLC